MAKTVAVIGASTNRSKYGNKAVRAYLARGWKVYAVHPTARTIEGAPAVASIRDIPEPVDRATLYLPPDVGLAVLDDVAAKGVGELYVNPGAESDALLERARQLGLDPIVACSIVDVGVSPASLPDA